jgi:hypothetical protein
MLADLVSEEHASRMDYFLGKAVVGQDGNAVPLDWCQHARRG